jgi:hypothetical protein
LALCIALPQPAAAEVRCGWLVHPTPGNLWLKDDRGDWLISTQGGPYAEGVERLPEPTPGQFVKSNGDYGYSCACVQGAFDAKTTSVTRIDAARALPLSVCYRNDKLPRP